MNRNIVRAKYEELGFTKGWSFLACPEARLRDAKIAIVGTNPGGGGEGDEWIYDQIWSVEDYNAFYDEPTKHRAQVRLWHKSIPVWPDETLCAQFIPFRSPDLARLDRQTEAIAFARDLWRWVLDRSPAKLFITMGELPAIHLVDLLGAQPVVENQPTHWGKTTIDVFDSRQGHRIIRMPHPSRYGVIGRNADTDAFFKAVANFDLS